MLRNTGACFKWKLRAATPVHRRSLSVGGLRPFAADIEFTLERYRRQA
jgi:hypothetical protein